MKYNEAYRYIEYELFHSVGTRARTTIPIHYSFAVCDNWLTNFLHVHLIYASLKAFERHSLGERPITIAVFLRALSVLAETHLAILESLLGVVPVQLVDAAAVRERDQRGDQQELHDVAHLSINVTS